MATPPSNQSLGALDMTEKRTGEHKRRRKIINAQTNSNEKNTTEHKLSHTTPSSHKSAGALDMTEKGQG